MAGDTQREQHIRQELQRLQPPEAGGLPETVQTGEGYRAWLVAYHRYAESTNPDEIARVLPMRQAAWRASSDEFRPPVPEASGLSRLSRAILEDLSAFVARPVGACAPVRGAAVSSSSPQSRVEGDEPRDPGLREGSRRSPGLDGPVRDDRRALAGSIPLGAGAPAEGTIGDPAAGRRDRDGRLLRSLSGDPGPGEHRVRGLEDGQRRSRSTGRGGAQ